MLSVVTIRINGREDTPTVEQRPVFSLVLGADCRGEVLTKCRLQMMQEDNNGTLSVVGDTLLHNPNPVSIACPPEFALEAHTSYCVRAMVWNQAGEPSSWSALYTFHAAFVAPQSWQACFISADYPDEAAGEAPCFWFSRSFCCANNIASAVLYITALGVYTPRVNGQKITRDILTPGYMDYTQHLSYQRYDITAYLQQGKNVLEVLLGDGWYKGNLSSSWHRNYYGNKRELLCELHLTARDGTQQRIVSDGEFCWRLSSVLSSEIYNGELCDGALQTSLEENDKPVVCGVVPFADYLHPDIAAPMHEDSVIYPTRIFTSPKGERIVDFGRIVTGVVEVSVAGKAGDAVVLVCGDTLDSAGNFYNDNTELFSMKTDRRPTMQRIDYRLRGDGEECYRPTFTYQCFRYVKIEAFPGDACPAAFKVITRTSFTRQTGYFRCGDAAVNQLFQNVIHTQYATYMDIPIAGPQRAERLGWTGDNQLITATSCKTMFDTLHFFGKWLEDMRYDQFPNGQVAVMAPYISFSEDKGNSQANPMACSAWGDAAVIVPWTLYQFYGDIAILHRYYGLAKGYVDYMHQSGTDEFLFLEGFSFGDWFALDNGPDAYPGKTDQTLIACFYFYYSTLLLTKMQRALDKTQHLAVYQKLAQQIREKLLETYFNPDGTITLPTQTSCVMAIAFGIADNKAAVMQQLLEQIHEADDHLLTGFIGTSMVLQVLCDNGQASLAYKLLRTHTYPSWLYCVDRGASTIWEHWNGQKPDGTLWDPNMNSFCHLTLGSVADWFFSHVLGIRQTDDGSGYNSLVVYPMLNCELGNAGGSFATVQGEVSVDWRYNGEQVCVSVTVPVGCKAELVLSQAKQPECLAELVRTEGVGAITAEPHNHLVRLHCLSGSYCFTYPAF